MVNLLLLLFLTTMLYYSKLLHKYCLLFHLVTTESNAHCLELGGVKLQSPIQSISIQIVGMRLYNQLSFSKKPNIVTLNKYHYWAR